MKCYRGYYIDHARFNTERDIDDFIKEQSIEKYKRLCAMFADKPSMELTVIMCDQSDFLHNACGLSYVEIEEIEIETLKAV